MIITSNPLWWWFPRLSLALTIAMFIGRGVGRLVRWLWPYRRELLLLAAVVWLWAASSHFAPSGWALVAVFALIAATLWWDRSRRLLLGFVGAGRLRRRLHRIFTETNTLTVDGQPPAIRGVSATPVGYRVRLSMRPGQSAERLDLRGDELRAGLHAREIRIRRDPGRADRVEVDIVHTDPLTGTQPVVWASTGVETLSIWDPVHFGASEWGEPVWLSLVERAVLIGGNRGAGKSSGITVLIAHAAKSPDVELLLIDPNRVQLYPWRDRAMLFADHHVDDAIDVVRRWRDEIDRRLDVFTTLPGQPLALTRAVADQHGLPMWLLVIDELAYHMSVAGTAAQQKEFYNLLRDGVARGRAAGMGVIAATQRPTHDLIPTSLRDLFDIRIAYRTMTTTSSNVILGDEFARLGFSATDIGIQQRGVCWLLGDEPTPVRLKTVWIPSEMRQDLAVSTVFNRPSLRPLLDGEGGDADE
jgi:S-DNA-T family DNA segregation ATPase FtsK/SpoIIIE